MFHLFHFSTNICINWCFSFHKCLENLLMKSFWSSFLCGKNFTSDVVSLINITLHIFYFFCQVWETVFLENFVYLIQIFKYSMSTASERVSLDLGNSFSHDILLSLRIFKESPFSFEFYLSYICVLFWLFYLY